MLTRMFARFLSQYPLGEGHADEPWDAEPLFSTPGYLDLARQVTGLPLCGGMLRLVGEREGGLASEFIREGFPEFAARAAPFAVDWIGRVVALDRGRPPGLLLIEPGSADAFEIDESFADFFNVDVVDDPDTFLAADLFRDWQAAGGGIPGVGQCIGFKVPLFLGGSGTVSNLEQTDLEVYWSFAAQLRARTRGLPPGTRIGSVDGR
jgi:Domain of unknown function (DUF1851)